MIVFRLYNYYILLLHVMKTQYKSPELVAKSKSYKDLGFGNNVELSLTKEGEHDISVLSAVVSKYFSGDCDEDDDVDQDDDEEEDDEDAKENSLYDIPLKGRMRSNSMPELPSASSRYRRTYLYNTHPYV